MNMNIIKMSSKGQFVIPVDMRTNLKEGEEMLIIKDNERFVLKKTGQLTEKMRDDLEFARRTEEVWREIEEGKSTTYSVEEYFDKLENGN